MIRYFRRALKTAVITGGDRPDMALAALETDTSVLILTGNLHPDKGTGYFPIFLVSYDTYTAVDRVKDVTGKIRVDDRKRINEAKRLISKYVNWKELLSYLNLDVN